jgi:hypothetical protein
MLPMAGEDTTNAHHVYIRMKFSIEIFSKIPTSFWASLSFGVSTQDLSLGLGLGLGPERSRARMHLSFVVFAPLVFFPMRFS